MPNVVKLVCAFALLFPSLARAELDRVSEQLGSEVRFELLHGYPHSPRALEGPFTFGVELSNAGAERDMRVVVSGALNLEHTLRVPARERRRWFAYLPARQGAMAFCSLTLTDLTSGASKTIELERGRLGALHLARLGPLSSALNVDKPFTMVGAIDSFMPDDWRGLAGLRVIVMEHAHALAQPPDWRVLIDWVGAGGILVLATPVSALAEALPVGLPLPLAGKIEEHQAGLVQRVGAGLIARVYPEQLAEVGPDFLQRIGSCAECGWNLEPLRAYDTSQIASARLASAVRGPGWPIIGVLIAFALVAGPGGYIRFVIRRRRPLAYVGFAIAASLAFSVLVLAVDLVRNGVRARLIPHSLLVIDQRAELELGVEEIAAHVPFGPGPALLARPGLQLMLPQHRGDGAADPLDISVRPHGLMVQGALPARTRRLFGARWIGRARGKLVVQPAPGGLVIENHLGSDLQNLVLWHDGIEYGLHALARGTRAVATPSLRSVAHDASDLLVKPFTAAATDLVRRIVRGELGEQRYVADSVWHASSSGVLEVTSDAYRPGRHLIAGVYR